MTISIEFWQLLGGMAGMLTGSIGVLYTFGKLLIGQFERNLTQRFIAQEQSRVASQQHWDDRFSKLEKTANDERNAWMNLERELLLMKAQLPTEYVRREDYIRNQAVIEAKLDGLAVKIENATLLGVRNG